MSTHTLVGGQVVSGVHSEDKCAGEYCTIHRPSNHVMVGWDQQFIYGVMYRISPDGRIYPDPDGTRIPDRPNAIRCLGCDVVLVSLYRHDYRTCACENASMVDGGYEYHRRGWNSGTVQPSYIEIETWPIRKEWIND